MRNENLFTIGALAKLSGAKVKALRYYEKIDLLIPVYINPKNGYRFYTNRHIYLVAVIRLCTELNIPLSVLKKYITADSTEIQVSLLISECIKKANEKLLEIQETLQKLESFQNDMNESEYKQEQICEKFTPEGDYWFIPYDGPMNTTEYFSLLAKGYYDIEDESLVLSENENDGMVLFIKDGQQTLYIFIELKKQEYPEKFKNIVRLPAGSYLQTTTTVPDIKETPRHFSKLFSEDSPLNKENYAEVIFMKELLTKTLSTNIPLFEINYLLPDPETAGSNHKNRKKWLFESF